MLLLTGCRANVLSVPESMSLWLLSPPVYYIAVPPTAPRASWDAQCGGRRRRLEEAHGRGASRHVPGTVGKVHGSRTQGAGAASEQATRPVFPDESQEELDRIAKEDQRRALEGPVELRTGDEVWYKHIDELTREDRPARIELENARAA